MSRTKFGKDVICVGDKEGTLDALVELIQRRTQYTDYMEVVLDLVTVNTEEQCDGIREMTHSTHSFRICDLSLPECNTGFVYFLLSTKRQRFTYIGETKDLRRRLNQHNSGHGSMSTTHHYLRPFAVLAYICGFDDNKPLREYVEKRWKEERDKLIRHGNDNVKDWARSGPNAINEIDRTSFSLNGRPDLRLILLYKE